MVVVAVVWTRKRQRVEVGKPCYAGLCYMAFALILGSWLCGSIATCSMTE